MTTENSSGRSGSVGNNSKAFYDIISIASKSIRRLGGNSALDAFVDSVKKKLDEETDPGYASRLKHGHAYIVSLVDAMKDASDSAGVSAQSVAQATVAAPRVRDEAKARFSNKQMMLDLLESMKQASPANSSKLPYPSVGYVVAENSEGDRVVRLCSRDCVVDGKKAQIMCDYDGAVVSKKHPLLCLGPNGSPCFEQSPVDVNGKTEYCFAKVLKYKEEALIRYWYSSGRNNINQWYGQLRNGKLVAVSREEYRRLENGDGKVVSIR